MNQYGIIAIIDTKKHVLFIPFVCQEYLGKEGLDNMIDIPSNCRFAKTLV